MGTGPSSLANCVGWFESDNSVFSDAGTTPITNGGTIQQWNDLSGDTNHMVQATANSRPYWYSDPSEPFPLVRFPRNDATSARVIAKASSPTLDRGAMSVFAVARHDGSQGSTSGSSMFLFGGGTTGTYGSIEVGQPGYPSPRCTYRLGVTSSFAAYTTNRVPNSLCFQGISCGAASTTAYLDDKSSTNGTVYGSGTSTGWALGAATNALGSPWYGDVVGLFVFTSALSAGNVATLKTYCQNRWNLPTITYNVVFEGDSLTSGVSTTLSNRVLSWQAGLPRDYRTHCVARAGETLSNMVSDFSTQVHPCFDSSLGSRKNVLVVWGGTNDISGSSGATVYASYASYCRTARANGWRVVAVTMLPRNTGGNETNRTDFNTLLRAGWSGFADALADVDACSAINTVALTAGRYYESDRIHLSEEGNRLVGPIFQRAIIAAVTPRRSLLGLETL